MAAVAGFDFVLVDCEHGPAELVALRQHIAVAAIHGVPVLVRIGEGDPGMILRALDQGAQGILAPHSTPRRTLQPLVSATHYPPARHPRLRHVQPRGRFGETDPAAHRDWFLANTLVLGDDRVARRGRGRRRDRGTPGLDGIMIGPADLAAASGPDDLPLPQATARVNAAIAAAGKLRMDIVGTPDAASEHSTTERSWSSTISRSRSCRTCAAC